MVLSSLYLKNIRKHTDTHIEFADNLNYIVGGNGVGKTTILEAIYYLCTTKSCLTSSDAEVVKIGETGFNIRGNFISRNNESVQVNYSATDNKKVFMLSNKLAHKFSEVIGKFPVVMLSPSDHSITQGYPAERRKFVDSVISQASRTYLNLLLEYNRTLKQKSNLLFRIKENNNKDENELDAWNERLVQTGTEIIDHRKKFVEEFSLYITESYQKILSKKEVPGIIYYFLEGNSQDNTKDVFYSLLEQRKAEEIRRAQNLVGPHKDDFIFNINELNLKSYGSQGQHKTFQTVLRFAEYFYLNDKTGSSPIFLLDDVFGELDAERAAAISNYLSSVGQAFITITDFANFTFLKTGENDKVIKLTADSRVVYE
jgi:DNA replication and repair protein RecF